MQPYGSLLIGSVGNRRPSLEGVVKLFGPGVMTEDAPNPDVLASEFGVGGSTAPVVGPAAVGDPVAGPGARMGASVEASGTRGAAAGPVIGPWIGCACAAPASTRLSKMTYRMDASVSSKPVVAGVVPKTGLPASA
jgi:hypothetical protein